MSTDWDIACKTCGPTHRLGVEDANHADDSMRAIIRLAPHLAALGKAADVGYINVVGADLPRHNGNLNLTFFVTHEGHELAPIDEYGRWDGQCWERFQCPCCKHTEQCQMESGHTGDHGRKP